VAGIVRQRVFKNTYRDSVELMRIATDLERFPGVTRAGVVMATPANRDLLAGAGLLLPDAADTRPADLIVAVAAESDEAGAAAMERAAAALAGPARPTGEERRAAPMTTLHDALAETPGANLALVSAPGAYATAEALKALKRGLHVFLFSDNVPVADEIALKELAERKDLLLMGPDCGTAILDGVPLGFANAVRRGRIGLIGASGTGLQEVSCLIDRLGEGVSQVIGVGGRDLDDRVGGRMTLAALRRLAADDGTAVIAVISKPPGAAAAERVMTAVRECPKPVVVNFLGWTGETGGARTFEDAALDVVALARGVARTALALEMPDPQPPPPAQPRFAQGQTEIRGLYCGGSLAAEAALVLGHTLGDAGAGRATIVDLGDDRYTTGRLHPMIDPRLRNQHIVEAARDPRVAVILLDVVLGYNAHPNPARALIPALDDARHAAAVAGRDLVVVASVCGTPDDLQDFQRQHTMLAGRRVWLAPSNARAARLAASALGGAAPSPVDPRGPSRPPGDGRAGGAR
jgi:FdrA protein